MNLFLMLLLFHLLEGQNFYRWKSDKKFLFYIIFAHVLYINLLHEIKVVR